MQTASHACKPHQKLADLHDGVLDREEARARLRGDGEVHELPCK